MSFALQVSAASYVGNASTVTAYPVVFPVVAADHIAVTVATPTGATPVLLDPTQYTVHLAAGVYTVTTATAWAATDTVTIFRMIPFDQPFQFPEGGYFPTKEIERSMDRIVMQVQQLWRHVTGGEGGTVLPSAATAVKSIAVFADETALNAGTPDYAGQLAVVLSTGTVYVGNTTTTGDWSEYASGGAINNVILRTGGSAGRSYQAVADTNASRWAALKLALQEAALAPTVLHTIELAVGRFTVPSGESMVDYAPSENVTIIFGKEAALVYTTPADASPDANFFQGARNPVNFGAVPDLTFGEGVNLSVTTVLGSAEVVTAFPRLQVGYAVTGTGIPSGATVAAITGTGFTLSAAATASGTVTVNMAIIPDDNWPFFEACKLSCPPYPGSPVDEDGEIIRSGRFNVPRGRYRMGAPFVQQATQYWNFGHGEHRAWLYYDANLAPGAPASLAATIWCWRVARGMYGGAPSANFTHDLGLTGPVFSCDPTGNDYLGGILWGSAQNSFLTNITISGLSAGIRTHSNTANVDFADMHLVGISGLLGPAFDVRQTNNSQFRSISVVHFNNNGGGSGMNPDTDWIYTAATYGPLPMPAYKFYNCVSNNVVNVLAENSPHAFFLHSCYTNLFGIVQGTADPAAATRVLINLRDSSDNTFVRLWGKDYDETVQEQGVVVLDGSAGIKLSNYTQDQTYLKDLVAGGKVTSVNADLTGFLKLIASGSQIQFTRPDSAVDGSEMWLITSGAGSSNPSLSFYSQNDAGGSVVEHLNLANANGGTQSGFNVSAINLFSHGAIRSETTIRSETGFYFGVNKVVGAQGAAVADAASADATDLATAITLVNELKAQLNTLLARERAHGLIAT